MLDRKDFFKKGFVNLFKKVKETQDMVAEVPFLIKESLSEKVTPEEESNALRTIPEFSKSKKIKKNIGINILIDLWSFKVAEIQSSRR